MTLTDSEVKIMNILFKLYRHILFRRRLQRDINNKTFFANFCLEYFCFLGQEDTTCYMKLPVTPGHEFSGRVVELGEGAKEHHR